MDKRQNYDLVVIDESHNFRNGGEITGEDAKENRYLKLLNRVIRAGVRTKVLMLSATPVNNKFIDLKNQLALAYEGDAAPVSYTHLLRTAQAMGVHKNTVAYRIGRIAETLGLDPGSGAQMDALLLETTLYRLVSRLEAVSYTHL